MLCGKMPAASTGGASWRSRTTTSGRTAKRHAHRSRVGSFSGSPTTSTTPKIACQTAAYRIAVSPRCTDGRFEDECAVIRDGSTPAARGLSPRPRTSSQYASRASARALGNLGIPRPAGPLHRGATPSCARRADDDRPAARVDGNERCEPGAERAAGTCRHRFSRHSPSGNPDSDRHALTSDEAAAGDREGGNGSNPERRCVRDGRGCSDERGDGYRREEREATHPVVDERQYSG